MGREIEASENVYWGVLSLIATYGRKRTKEGLVYDAVCQAPENPTGSFEAAMAIQNCPKLGVCVGGWWAFTHLCQPVIGWGLPWAGDMTLGEVTLFSWSNAKEDRQLKKAGYHQQSLQVERVNLSVLRWDLGKASQCPLWSVFVTFSSIRYIQSMFYMFGKCGQISITQEWGCLCLYNI